MQQVEPTYASPNHLSGGAFHLHQPALMKHCHAGDFQLYVSMEETRLGLFPFLVPSRRRLRAVLRPKQVTAPHLQVT